MTAAERAAAWQREVERHPDAHCAGVRLAVARHVHDLESLADYRFDLDSGARVVRFIERLPVVKGRAKRLVLQGWQCWWVVTLFGWLDAGGHRRFREAQLWVPRKNGKSTLAAAIALWLLCCDGEEAPEVYTAASKMDQARIVADIAHRMARRQTDLREWAGLRLAGNSNARPPHIVARRNDGILRPLARDQQGSQDGLDVSGAIVDEIHAHPLSSTYDALTHGTGARSQPLIVITSTAGYNAAGVGKARYDALMRVLRGEQQNERLFGIPWAADEDDDWHDERVWRRVNPGVGRTVTLDSLRQAHTEAENTHAANTFRVKRLNQWTSIMRQWMDMAMWRRCGRSDLAPPAGARVWAGVHLSAGNELSAGALLWMEGDAWRTTFRCWAPARVSDRRRSIEAWIESGAVIRSGGTRIRVEDVTTWLSGIEGLAAVCLDPRSSGPLSVVWEPLGLPCVDVLATPANLSWPMRSWRAAVEDGAFAHDANPAVEWMVASVQEVLSINGSTSTPRASAADARIDAAVALLLAAAVALGWRESEAEPGRFIDLLND